MMVSLVLILSDTTILGAIFIGALILLEKQQAVIHTLFVTPLKPSNYILSKSLSLSAIAITMSILIYLPVWQASAYTILIFFTTIITAGIFVMFGIPDIFQILICLYPIPIRKAPVNSRF